MATHPGNVFLLPNAALLPLPPGWSEHLAPTGQLYYYNAAAGTSTYTRPLPSYPPASAATTAPTAKEKPLYKIPVLDTPWLRVKTNQGNVFFAHVDRKESVWSVPEEIAAAVSEMDWKALEEQAAHDNEIARLQKEVERDSLKRKAENPPPVNDVLDPTDPSSKPQVLKKRKKRIAVDDRPAAISEFDIESVAPRSHEGENAEDETSSGDDEDSGAAFSSTSAEETWRREMAGGLSKLAEQAAAAIDSSAGHRVSDDASSGPNSPRVQSDGQKAFTVPEQVNLSLEEARTLFKTLLTEKNPNRLAPFAAIMPVLITDPRYVLLSSQSEREAAFNEWCRETARETRLAKSFSIAPMRATPGDSGTGGTQKCSNALGPASAKQHAREAYNALLKAEVTSTRITWNEFRRKWKKDRRFFAFGRDEREREKVFRAWLKDLGGQKRAQARKAEFDFTELLKSNTPIIPITTNSQWKDVKHRLVKDPRYDAVGSSSLREDLFNTFLLALASSSLPPVSGNSVSEQTSPVETQSDRKARIDKALRDREERANHDRERIQEDIGRSKAVLITTESEVELMGFFVDTVREPTANYQDLEATLGRHPRFSSSPLTAAQKRSLFHGHIVHLREKYLTALHALFLSYSPLLSSKFSDLTPEQHTLLDSSLPAQKLGFKTSGSGTSSMRCEWEAWLSKRTVNARADFQKLLEENSFVKFWGKICKIEDANEDDRRLVAPGEEDLQMGGGVAADDASEGKADLKTLAKSITEKEIERVLQNDQRYRAFDHLPEERVCWVKDYVSSLSAPRRSVHVQSHQH